jgi:carboxypeptidase family protein
VLRGTLSQFAVEAPADLRVVTATAVGNTVTSFEADPGRPNRRTLRLGNPVPAGGSAEVFWLLAREEKPQRGTWLPPEITLPDFLRGEIAVAVVSARPVLLAESESKRSGYERIDELDLPAELKELTDSPVLYAARRAGTTAPRLALDISTLPELPGLPGVIDRARLLTIVTPLGQRIDRWRLELQTRETLLRVALPEGEIWSALLDGKAFRPLREGRELLVPMGRGSAALGQRVLEVVVAAPPSVPLPKRGELRLELPRLPYSATAVLWDLFLPEKSEYRVSGGTVAEPPRLPESGASVAGYSGAADARAALNVVHGTGRLSGRIVDSNGGPLPGVTATVIGEQGWRRSTTTDARGNFQFANLPEGRARLKAELSGFASTEQALDIRGDANLNTTIPMSLDTVNSVVTVGAEAPLGSPAGINSYTIQANSMSAPRRTAKAATTEQAKPIPTAALSDEERAALQRTTQAGVATIPVQLPTAGKRLALAGYLLVEDAPQVQIQIRPARRGWLW